MSFDQLPVELVACIASFVSYKDIAKLLLTQKRVYNVLKRYQMDRPSFEELSFNFTGHRSNSTVICKAKEKKESASIQLFTAIFEDENWDMIVNTISKFRSLSLVTICGEGHYISLTDEYAQNLANVETKVSHLRLVFCDLKMSASCIVDFCKKFDVITLKEFNSPKHINWDDVLCQILPNTAVDEFFPVIFVASTVTNRIASTVTDRTLQAARMGMHFHNFRFFDFTKFTIREIRLFIEDAINKNVKFYVKFGILPRDQLIHAMEWFNYVSQAPNTPYIINRPSDRNFEPGKLNKVMSVISSGISRRLYGEIRHPVKSKSRKLH